MKKKFVPFWLKLFACYSAIIICMFSIALIIIFPKITSHYRKETQLQLQEQAEQVIDNLEYQLDLMRGIYMSIIIDEHLQNAFLNQDPSDTFSIDSIKYISEKLSTISNIWGGTTYVYLYNNATQTFYSSETLSTISLTDTSWLDIAKTQQGMYTFHVGRDTNRPSHHSILSLSGPIRKDITGNELGYFSVNLKLPIYEALTIPPKFTDGTLHMLFDRNGTFVMGDTAISVEESLLEGKDSFELDNEKYLVCSVSSKEYGFSHYILTPIEEAYYELNLLINVIVVTICTIILASIFISFFLAKQITSPIEKLTTMMNRYQGDSDSLSVIEDLHLTNEFHVLNDGLIHMSSRINTLINDVYQHQIMHQQLELKTLYKAINPHFIYNVLDSIQWELRFNKTETALETLYTFSNYLRNTLILNQDTQSIQTMRNAVHGYCNLQQILMDDIICEYNIPEELDDYILPSMLVLPLVENCFVHAFPVEYEREKKITISAELMDSNLIIRVKDTGSGICAEDLHTITLLLRNPLSYQLEENSTRFFALKNIQSRILLTCGENYGMEVTSDSAGTLVTMYLPIQKKHLIEGGN